jgi:signal transduction histidine kinase
MAGFKARARALDMLGRQQISGIPTAISELFKNAYDAYADNVIVDYFRADGLLVLRDDGFGMTKDDFENRWLTIGTESKVDSEFGGLKNIEIPDNKERRPVMGEKGIGRLAIAMLGHQILIVTRAKRKKTMHNYVVSFINWRLFELPGLNLEDIYIPVKEFMSFPTNEEIQRMIEEVRQHIEKVVDKVNPTVYQEILNDLADFNNFDIEKRERNLKEPCKYNSSEDTGTRFYIFPSNPLILDDLKDSSVDDDASHLKKMLIGFTDDIMPGHKKSPLKTHFRDYKYPEYYEDVISETSFFTEEEFDKGDHLFTGRFNEKGQFIGRVKIFGKEQEQEYVIPWTKSKGKNISCGPFELVVTTIQGKESESLLNKDSHNILEKKLYKYGGLYVYKDGIRILPYGNNKHDFLDIEYRRSKHAGTYYWSYRRLIGAIRLQSGINDTLKEKAGREGFQDSSAFREMREILMNFFIQSAKDFFSDDGEYAEEYLTTRSKNAARDAVLKKDGQKKKAKKEKFTKELDGILKILETQEYVKDKDKLLDDLNKTLALIDTLEDKEIIAHKLIEAERSAFEDYYKLKDTFNISKPRGISLSNEVERNFKYYKNKINDLNENFFKKTYIEIEQIIGEKSRNAKLELDRRRRIEESLNRLSKDAKKQIQQQVKFTGNTLSDVKINVESSTKESLKNVEGTIRDINFSLGETDFQDMSEDDIYTWRMNIENRIISVMESEKKELETIQALLDNVKWEKDKEGNIASYIDVIEASDSKLNELQEKAQLDSDLAQLGMAIHVINHEFDASIKMVRDNLRRLKAWADVNQGIGGIYSEIKNSFDHLDSYLTLFTPLNRRMRRSATDIRGHQIEEFILKLFAERFNRHNIKLISSKDFRQSVLKTIPSSIYPVFVNIIDNATYWIKGYTETGIIELDVDTTGFTISNNGPKISEVDKDAIFEMGFTRKPSGRGLGLHISNEVLREQGMSLEVIEPIDGFNVTFRIVKPKGKQ